MTEAFVRTNAWTCIVCGRPITPPMSSDTRGISLFFKILRAIFVLSRPIPFESSSDRLPPPKIWVSKWSIREPSFLNIRIKAGIAKLPYWGAGFPFRSALGKRKWLIPPHFCRRSNMHTATQLPTTVEMRTGFAVRRYNLSEMIIE